MIARILSLALAVSVALLALTAGPRPAAAAPGQVPSVTDPRYFAGVNVAWFNWGCDFGCGTQNGVRAPAVNAALREGFGRLQRAGVHAARWWTFEGDPMQIERDASGAPTRLNPAVYADFDAALALADQYDLAYVFVLFSAPTALPQAWVNDPGQRQKLADALAPLFERYKDHPRILAWEYFNEPEYDIWGGKVSKEAVQETVRVLNRTVKSRTSTATTVGAATLEGVPLWSGLGLDFHSPHWYDNMSTGIMCVPCSDVPQLRNSWIFDGLPIVLGEVEGAPTMDTQKRLTDYRAKGYSGAWIWSLFYDKTQDQKQTDLNAMARFIASLGSLPAPVAQAAPTPAPAAPSTAPGSSTTEPGSPVRLLTNWLSPTYAIAGDAIVAHQDIVSTQDTSVLVSFEVYNSAGEKVSQVALDNQALTARQTSQLSTSIPLPATLPPGRYTVKTGAFAAGWGPMYAWSDAVGTVVVEAGPTLPPAPAPPAPEPAAQESADPEASGG
jgi:hypothetical protein